MNRLQFLCLAAMALATVCAVTPASAQSSTPGLTLRPAAPNATAASPASPSPAAPVSAETLQAAKELVGLVSTSVIADTVKKITAQVWPAMEASLRNQNANIDEATTAEMRSEFERLMVGSLSDTAKELPEIYARYFTSQEMRDLIAFYRTPTGAKTLKVMPQVNAELMAVTASRLQGTQQKVYLAFLNILQKRGLYAQ